MVWGWPAGGSIGAGWNWAKGEKVGTTVFVKTIKNEEKSKANSSIKKWAKDLNRYLTKEDIQISNKQMKSYSRSYVIKELQIKIIIR